LIDGINGIAATCRDIDGQDTWDREEKKGGGRVSVKRLMVNWEEQWSTTQKIIPPILCINVC
jgi:hypothetical protein